MSKCIVCGEEAEWERITQFSGIHPYCDEHARMQEDFMEMDRGYFFWCHVSNEDDEGE